MEIKKLSKAAKLLDRIKALDQEIIKLDKIGLTVVNDRTEINLNLSVKNLTKEEDDKCKVSFDTDGSLMRGTDINHGFSGLLSAMRAGYYDVKPDDKNTELLKKNLSPEDFLKVIQVLHASRMNERSLCFKKLAELGVNF